ncbi:MAG: LPS-assembly protein LptD [Bacteroidetes bacterium]|nr:LPS-assembly protein LptD [Bacteroidota bacterium]
MNNRRKSIGKIAGQPWLCLFFMMLFVSLISTEVNAQIADPKAKDSISFSGLNNQLKQQQDTVAKNGEQAQASNPLADSLGIKISPDGLSDVVTATATDSAVLDMQSNIFYLFGDAEVKYQDLILKAGEVSYDQAANTISAEPLPPTDSVTKDTVRPTFQQGSETFTYDYLKYNFKSKRAIVRNARSQYGEGFVHSEQIKRNADNSIYGWHSVYTTCALDTPHFGIRANRIKIIPGQIIVTGSANLTVEGVPTPIYLPFGVFPVSETQRSGFRIPSYTIEERRGLGITNGGYYFHLSDYADLLLLGTFYSKGSYSASAVSTYAKRYHYTGGFSFNYAYNKLGEVYEPGSSIDKQFALQWRHATDAKAHPGQTFSTNVNIQKGNYYSDNSYNPNQITQNQFASSISYQKNWKNKPFSFAASADFNQNTATHVADLQLPNLSFSVAQITPFANNNRIGKARWYEKISLSYSFSGISRTSFYDTAFQLSRLSLNDFKYGIRHTVPISASYTMARYINVSFNINYNEYWLTEQLYQYYNNVDQKLDSVQHRGFFTARDMNASANFSTRIYGIKRWNSGTLAGIRHVLTPNASFTYTPDLAAKPFNNAYKTYLTPGGNFGYYSPYTSSVVGTPGLGQFGKYASTINFGLNNNLQLKTRKGKDSTATTKNITLIDGLSLNSGYNLAADSFGWSNVTMSFRTNILDKISINGGANFTPYIFDHDQGRPINQLAWNNGGFLNFQNANLGLNSSFRAPQRNKNTETSRTEREEVSRMMRSGYGDYVDFNIPWTLNIGYNLSLNKRYRTTALGGDTLVLEHSALFSGDFNLTPNWKVTFSSGYNFTTRDLSMTSINILRDLHCWEMSLGTFPFGPRKSYNFSLNVKASVLQDLKLLRRRDYRDAAF